MKELYEFKVKDEVKNYYTVSEGTGFVEYKNDMNIRLEVVYSGITDDFEYRIIDFKYIRPVKPKAPPITRDELKKEINEMILSPYIHDIKMRMIEWEKRLEVSIDFDNLWKPIDTCPDDTEVLIKGVSGYRTLKQFVCNCKMLIHSNDNRVYYNCTGDNILHEYSWKPTHWRHI